LIRDIAQLGRAPALGAGCRRFKSYYPEIKIKRIKLIKRIPPNVDGIQFIFYTLYL
jgi:hypothetical protein